MNPPNPPPAVAAGAFPLPAPAVPPAQARPPQVQQQPVAAIPFGPAIGHTSYSQFYDDPANDPWKGSYGNVYQQYGTQGNQIQPQVLRSQLYSSGNNRLAICVLLHIRAATAPADEPGEIALCHRLTRFEPGLGQARPSFADTGNGFIGDVLPHGQAPFSVELPDTLFNRINTVTQVPHAGLLEQDLNAGPEVALVGPYPAGTADCSPVISRQAMLVPNNIARMFLHHSMSPKDAYQAVRGALQASGIAGDCEPLLDWLRLALTRPAANVPPRTAIAPLGPPVLANPDAFTAFQTYRLDHMHHDLPGITPGAILQLGQATQHGFASLALEQRLAR